MTEKPSEIKRRPLAIDPAAKSASPGEPAFIAPPDGAPVYYGFPILNDVNVEGFRLGKITDFEAGKCDDGDSFVVAPDGSRAGLVWEISKEPHFSEVCAEDDERWGVWAVNFPYPMNNHENAWRNLQAILPALKKKWHEWLDRKQKDLPPSC